MQNIKLVAMDLDDTLLDKSNAISPKARQTIRQAVDKGVTVTVATGRMYRSAVQFAKQLELDVPLITYNGALIKCSESGEVYYHQPLDHDVAHEILDLFRQRGWYIQSYVDDAIYVEAINDKTRYYEELTQVKAIPVGEKMYNGLGAPTKLLALAAPEEIAAIRAVVKSTFGGRVCAVVSKPNYLEIIHPAVNKGKALAYLADRLAVSRGQVMAIGDSQNDLDMIEYAGWGVAMGNASDAVKAKAQAVTLGNDEDGVAEAIAKYVLNSL